MSEHAWKLTQDQKILVGRAIVEAIDKNEPLPSSPAEGKAWLLAKGLEFVDGPNGVPTGVQFNQSDKNTIMYIAVPPRTAIKAALADVRNSGQYDIPITYRLIASNNPGLTELDQFYFRVGDYTMAHCT